MPDLTDLLDRTTPRSVSPPDVAAIARVAARRRRRHRVAAPALAVAVLAFGVAFAASQLGGGPEQSVAVGSGIGDADLTEPIGEWRQVADPPFGARSPILTGTLRDGRVLSWGGHARDGGRPALDGGIYDPVIDEWEVIDPPPIPAPQEIVATELAADRLLVLWSVAQPLGVLRGAVYDVATRAWTALPPQDDIRVIAEGVGWTGEHLALVRLSHGAPELYGDHSADWRVDQPITLRWSYGDADWTPGTASPLGLRVSTAVAFDGARLAFVGGTTTDIQGQGETPGLPGPDRGITDDGALYDVATDTWTAIPPPPHGGGVWAPSSWLEDGRLFVGSGADRFSDPGANAQFGAAYDPATGTWTELPLAPVTMFAHGTTGASVYVEGEWTIVVAGSAQGGHSGPQPRPVLTPLGWEQAPFNDLHWVAGHFVATTATTDNPGDDELQAAVRTSAGTWLRTVDAPFTNRREPGMTNLGEDSLLVIGGEAGPNLVPQADAWILDLDP